jgi:hypothetical protein
MRVVFQIEIKTDISPHDSERRKAMIELFSRTARTLRTQCSMLSKGNPPTVRLISSDSENGEQVLPTIDS